MILRVAGSSPVIHPKKVLYYIYILYSQTSDLYYVGYTNNYQRRLRQHNEPEKNTYTSKHRPWFIKAIFECRNNEADAIRLEKFIKKQKSKIFLQRFIDSETSELTGKLAQLVYPEFSGRNFGMILRVVGSSPIIHSKKILNLCLGFFI